MATPAYGEAVGWEPAKPRLRPLRLAVAWVVTAASLYLASCRMASVIAVQVSSESISRRRSPGRFNFFPVGRSARGRLELIETARPPGTRTVTSSKNE